MIDLDDFREEHAEALDAASEFSRRARKGLPSDRWATQRQLHLVAKGIDAMNQIMAMQRTFLEAIVRAEDADTETE